VFTPKHLFLLLCTFLGGLLPDHQRDGLLYGDGLHAHLWPPESDGGCLGAHGLRVPGEVGSALRRSNAHLPVAGGRHRSGRRSDDVVIHEDACF
jgi:hypothetical protein